MNLSATHRHPPQVHRDHGHAVQFYDDDAFLVGALARYVSEGLVSGATVLVVATPAHRVALVDRLGADLRSLSRLALLDADETLERFMVDGVPDRRLFERSVGQIVDDAAKTGNGDVRAFGEMVDVLLRAGNARGAIALEELWNELMSSRRLTLLCAYVMSGFGDESHGAHLRDICSLHTDVAPAESFSKLETQDQRDREISRLQQRSRALEREIEERVRLEASLLDALEKRKEADDALRDFVDNAVFAMHSVGADGVILWANRAELDMLGYPREEYVGRAIHEFHVDADVIADIIARLARGETLAEREARVRCKDGQIKTLLISSNGAFRDGELLRTRCFSQDVTRRRLDETARIESDRLLTEALAREKAGREEAERTVHFNEMFAGMLGHDLRNPLSAITAGAHLLLRLNAGEKVGKTASRILSSTDRMARMVDQLLDFTRIRVGEGLRIRHDTMNMGELCHRVKDELEASQPDRAVEVSCEGCAVGAWDADRLLQVFSNLVGNALSHGEPCTTVEVHVDGQRSGEVIATVHNSGVVPADVLPVMFEPFRGSSKQRGAKGLGLGLFITQQIVLGHGGTIEVTSDAAHGTTFEIVLPRGGK